MIVSDITPMQSVAAIVFILGHMRRDAPNRKSPILDTIGVPAHYRAKIRVRSLGIVQVIFRIVVAQRHVLGGTSLIVDRETGQTCSVGYECCVDAWCGDGVLLDPRAAWCNDG